MSALLSQKHLKLGRLQLSNLNIPTRRPDAEIGEEQIRCRNILQTTGRLDFPVKRQKTQRLIWLATDEIVEIVADYRQGTFYQTNRSFVRRTFLLFDRFQQRFKRFGKLSDAIQTDNSQGALNLVQMRTTELDLRQVARTRGKPCCVLAQSLISTLQRQVDLAFDPGQRADIKFRRGIHS